MFYIILTVIAVGVPIIIATVNYREYGVGAEDWFLPWIASGLVSMIVYFVIFFITYATIQDAAEMEWITSKTVEINAMKDNFHIEGYGSGNLLISQVYIDEELKYTYKYYVDGKGWTTGTVDADKAYINKLPEGDTKPYLATLEAHLANDTMKFWFLDGSYKEEYVFYVPYDAQIIEEFVIDLE